MKAAGLTRNAVPRYLKQCGIMHTQIARGHKAQGTYVSYKDGVMLCKHLNLSSRQKNQVIQVINDHRDKSYDVTEESAQPSMSFDSNYDKKKVIANREEGRKEAQLEENAGAGAETEMGCEDDDEDGDEDGDEDEEAEDEEDEEDEDKEDEDEDENEDENEEDEDEEAEEDEKQEETANNCEEGQEKIEEETPTSPFQASFISQLQRVSPRLSSTGQNPSSWHLGSFGSNVLFPELNGMNNRFTTETCDHE